MNLKDHILAALKEEFDRLEELLAGLSEEQITTVPVSPSRTIKDDIAHLRAWQQRSIARMEAALQDRKPEYPRWSSDLDLESEEDTDKNNDAIYKLHRDKPWSSVHREWSEGFMRFLELGRALSERDLLDSTRYAWLSPYSLADVLIGSYDHHREHLEVAIEQLRPSSK